MKILETEEALRLGTVPSGEVVTRKFDLARMHAELRQNEKAIDCLKQTLGSGGGTDGAALTLMGIYAGDMGDEARQVKYYEEATRICSDGTPLFNLALYYEKKGDHQRALDAIDRAIDRGKLAPYFIVKSRLCGFLGNERDRQRNLALGMNAFGPMGCMNDWTLDWHLLAVRMTGEAETAKQIEQEQKRRKQKKESVAIGRGLLPGAAAGAAKCGSTV
jgi:tetratricopeptide (TPR) repeat protein